MVAEIVHDHDIAGTKGRQENLLDVGPEALAIDRSLDEPWRLRRLSPHVVASGGTQVVVRAGFSFASKHVKLPEKQQSTDQEIGLQKIGPAVSQHKCDAE